MILFWFSPRPCQRTAESHLGLSRTPVCLLFLLQMQVWDTAGQERFRTITQSYYRSAHGAVVAYDISRRSTFESVPHWIREVQQYGAASVVLVLVGKRQTCRGSTVLLGGADATQVAEKELEKKPAACKIFFYFERAAITDILSTFKSI